MKRNWLILAVFVIGCVLFLQAIGNGQETATSGAATASPNQAAAPKVQDVNKPQTEGAEPKIEFESNFWDFGEVGPKSQNSCEFKFKNTGTSILKIDSKIQTTCGCTVPNLSKEEYAPGENGTIKVVFTAGQAPGKAVKHLYVSSNDKVNPRAELIIMAEIKPKVEFEPKQLNLELNKENAGCPDIVLKSVDGQLFEIKGFTSTGDSITADYNSVSASKFVIKPKVDVEKLKKGLNGSIEIKLSHPECDMVLITFNARPQFEITPQSLVVFKAAPEKPVKKEIWILNNYRENFEIESTSSLKGDIVKVLSQEKVGNRYKLTVEVTPPAVEDKIKVFRDTLYINIKGGRKLEVPVIGSVQK